MLIVGLTELKLKLNTNINQRTSGTVNAHLIPDIYLNTFIHVHVISPMGRDRTPIGFYVVYDTNTFPHINT